MRGTLKGRRVHAVVRHSGVIFNFAIFLERMLNSPLRTTAILLLTARLCVHALTIL
jgi:hypothetical protein